MFFLQILLTSLVTGTQVLLLAAGLYLIHTTTKTINIALGATAMSGAYGFYLMAESGAPVLVCFGFGIAIAAGCGMISFFLFQRFIERSQFLMALVMSIAFSVALESLLAMIFGPEGRFLVDKVLLTFEFWGLRITQVGLMTIGIGAATALFAYIFLYLLPYGRVLRAVSQHKACASLLGIREKKVQWLIYAGSSALAGMIGILIGMNNAVTPLSGLHPLIIAFIAFVAGGINDFRGTIIASYVLVLVPELIIANNFGGVTFTASWKMVFVFALGFLMLLARPHGLLYSLTRKS